MTAIDRVWEQMKVKAEEYVREATIPTFHEAQLVVGALMRAAHVDPKPGKDVIEFYARELIELAKRAPENEPA